MALVNIGYGAAQIGSGKNVLIFTHEMQPKIYAKRFGARVTFRFPSRFGDLVAYEEEFVYSARKLLTGDIRIVGGAKKMSTFEIEDILKRLIDEGFEPDLLIDDYGDLIIPPREYSQRRFELKATYEWLRALGGEYGFPVWTASQVNRAAYVKEVVTEADVAEDIGKMETADVIGTICQTKEEAQKDRCRLFFPKVRDAKRGLMLDAKFYSESQAIISIGVTRQRESSNA